MDKTPKIKLLDDLREGAITPQEAVDSFEKLPLTAQKGGRVYEQKTADERRKQYLHARSVRSKIRESRIPFISGAFLPHFWLAQGLVVVGGESGRAKSTTCSNVLAGFLRENDSKSAIVISNEEATDAVYERTGCILLGVDYTAFFQGRLSKREEQAIQDCVINHILPRVEVIEDGKFDMGYLEDVQAVLDTAAIQRVGLVLIDYLQCITQSRKDPQLASFEISKKLGFYLKEYGKQNGVPVVCFAQLNASDSAPTMAARIQNDKTFFNHGFACIEVIPNFETQETTFKIHKDRFFGHTGKEVVCKFKGGRYEFVGEGEVF